MKHITFTIQGEPKGKGRPRFTTRGKFPSAYTPQDTADYETRVRNEYLMAARGTFLGETVKMNINCWFGMPKSASKKKRSLMLSGEIRPTKKPDADNIAKIIADALNGVAYRDDAQIVELTVKKYFSEDPRVEVSIWRFEQDGGDPHEP